jgi:hypothetical protein
LVRPGYKESFIASQVKIAGNGPLGCVVTNYSVFLAKPGVRKARRQEAGRQLTFPRKLLANLVCRSWKTPLLKGRRIPQDAARESTTNRRQMSWLVW